LLYHIPEEGGGTGWAAAGGVLHRVLVSN